ncbi:MAG: hypothetical protein WBD51_20110 [Burkholderiaceae bacterium]
MKVIEFKKSGTLIAALLLSAGLVACGGGGGGTPAAAVVPTTGTFSMVASEQEAKDLVVLVVGADDVVNNTQDSFKRAGPIGPLGSSTSTSGALAIKSATAAIARKAFSETLACSDIYSVGEFYGQGSVTSCTGAIAISSNLNQSDFDSNAPLPAGTYIQTAFQNTTITLSTGQTFSFGGTFTLTFLEPLDLNAGGLGLVGSYRLTADGLTGVDEDGISFGPESFTMDVTARGDGTASIVYDGVRVDSIDITGTGDPDSYRINSGSTVISYDEGYAEVSFSNWNVVNSVPQIGSSLTVTGADGSATVTVTSASATEVSFDVVITAGTTTESHTVVATVADGQFTVN